ncbi:hypothetical protein F2981_02450 [Sinorhizobium meliloti]|nr:hypothetical protein [Sinorhizobium meliloti]
MQTLLTGLQQLQDDALNRLKELQQEMTNSSVLASSSCWMPFSLKVAVGHDRTTSRSLPPSATRWRRSPRSGRVARLREWSDGHSSCFSVEPRHHECALIHRKRLTRSDRADSALKQPDHPAHGGTGSQIRRPFQAERPPEQMLILALSSSITSLDAGSRWQPCPG